MGRFESIIFNINIFIIISFLAMHLVGCGDSDGIEPYYPQTPTGMTFTEDDLESMISDYRDQCKSQVDKTAASFKAVCEINYGDLDPDYCTARANEEITKQLNRYDAQASFFKSGFLNCTYETEQCVRNLDLQLSSLMIHCGSYSF